MMNKEQLKKEAQNLAENIVDLNNDGEGWTTFTVRDLILKSFQTIHNKTLQQALDALPEENEILSPYIRYYDYNAAIRQARENLEKLK